MKSEYSSTWLFYFIHEIDRISHIDFLFELFYLKFGVLIKVISCFLGFFFFFNLNFMCLLSLNGKVFFFFLHVHECIFM